jgi:hypothetical protein
MSLPFVFKDEDKKAGGVVVEHRSEREERPRHLGLEAAAEELMKAMERKDVQGMANALTSAFYLLDAMPHVEGEHE